MEIFYHNMVQEPECCYADGDEGKGRTPYCLLSKLCSVSIRFLFLLLVELLRPVQQMVVAVGTVTRRERVHGNPLQGHEVAVVLSQLNCQNSDSITHPHYHYPVEVGGLQHGTLTTVA